MAKIMLVDDDTDFLAIQRRVLETQGHTVVTVDRADKAVDLATVEKPDLVVMDLMMEDEDAGFSLCYKIKKGLAGRPLPVIMITGVGTEHGFTFTNEGSEPGAWIKADLFLNKPIRPEELIGAVNKLLKKEQGR
ncbi:MAG: response regulator [Candidatus Brocadiia bacterium]